MDRGRHVVTRRREPEFLRDLSAPIASQNAAAHHQAGHAVATVIAFRTARLPMPPPMPVIKLVEITAGTNPPHQWGGQCFGPNIYATEWPSTTIDLIYRDAMEWQIVIDQAGGIAEAIHRGERRIKKVMHFATVNCSCGDDLANISAVLADLRTLTGRRHRGVQGFAERTLKLLLANWRAVEALAASLVRAGRIEGGKVERIVGPLLASSAAAMGMICEDCCIDTSPCNEHGYLLKGRGEYYMTRDDVWTAAGMPKRGHLCIGCLEVRLGRRLTPNEFIDCEINSPIDPHHTPRLRSRLTGKLEAVS
jgi:hypothetical protein